MFGDIEEVLYRCIVPECYWKLKKWLPIGEEKKMNKVCEIADHLIGQCISMKQETLKRRTPVKRPGRGGHQLINSLWKKRVMN